MIRMPFAEGPWWNRLRLQVQKNKKKSTPRTHMEIKTKQKQKIHHHASDIFSKPSVSRFWKKFIFWNSKGLRIWHQIAEWRPCAKHQTRFHGAVWDVHRNDEIKKLSHEYSILNFFDLFHFAWKWSTCTTSIWFKNFHTQLTITHCWLNVPVCFT